MVVKTAIRNEYMPEYISPPGEMLEELLEEREMTQAELARRTGRPTKTINEIVKGKTAITPETALQLERVFGVPASFWMKWEQAYQESQARQEEEDDLSDRTGWLDHFPIREMISRGWLDACDDLVEQLRELLNFLGIASPEQWDDVYEGAAFRQSQAFEVNPYAVAAWLRQGERLAQQIRCEPYDEGAFRQALHEVRNLTAHMDPATYQQQVQEICSKAGVAVVFVPELPETRVSGATKWLSPSKALIQLSLRYKRDDQLWFSFFHEAGHILKHGKRDVFLEGGEQTDKDLQKQETEVDRFAANFLIPPDEWKRLLTLLPDKGNISKETLAAFADEIGIASGIVVGRLQHEGKVPFTHYNSLKIPIN